MNTEPRQGEPKVELFHGKQWRAVIRNKAGKIVVMGISRTSRWAAERDAEVLGETNHAS